MRSPTRRAVAFLACAAAVVLGGGAAAQWPGDAPAVWNPDGTRVLALGVIQVGTEGDCFLGVVCVDVVPHETRPLYILPGRPTAAFAWADDGATAIIASDGGAGTTVHVVPPPGRGPARTFPVADARLPVSLLVRGDEWLLAANDIVRLDARTGAELGRVRARGETRFGLHAAGSRVAYVALAQHDGFDPATRAWELGWLDPRTLARTTLARFTPDGDWLAAPTPAFAPDGEGFAVVAQHRTTGAWAVRVHVGGQAIVTFAVLEPPDGPHQHEDQALGNVLWSRDGTTLWVGSERSRDRKLWRIPVATGVPQAFDLGHLGPVRCSGVCGLPVLSCSPDGARFAWHHGRTSRLRVLARPRVE